MLEDLEPDFSIGNDDIDLIWKLFLKIAAYNFN